MSLFKFNAASGEDRRGTPRRPMNARGVVCASGMETACVIVDLSDGGMRVRLDRSAALPHDVVVVDVVEAVAYPATVVWQKGHEAGLKQTGGKSLRGLAPARLIEARAAWLRAGGR